MYDIVHGNNSMLINMFGKSLDVLLWALAGVSMICKRATGACRLMLQLSFCYCSVQLHVCFVFLAFYVTVYFVCNLCNHVLPVGRNT